MLGLGINVIIPAGGYPMLLFTREQSFAIGGATVLNGLRVAVAGGSARPNWPRDPLMHPVQLSATTSTTMQT